MIWDESQKRVASDTTINTIQNLASGLELETRPYQMRIASKAVQMLQGEFQRGDGMIDREAESVMIESPTGSGKTVMGLLLARWMQQRFGYSIGWVAMRRNLLQQAQAENERRRFGVDLQTVSMFDKNPPKVDMLIIDEAQHDAANSMASLHCHVQPKKVVGLTATPFRTDRMKLCFDRVIKDVGIHTLIQDGYLSRYHHFTIPDFDPRTVANTFLKERKKWGKSIMFFHRLEHCLECQNLLTNSGVNSQIVTANSNRERQLARFETGEVDVLINMNILTEGFDCPNLQTVFCRPSSRSCTIQMAGRVLRQHPDLPVKQVVQSKDTRHPFIKTAMADQQFIASPDGWRSLTLNTRIAEITDRARKAIAGSTANLPKVVVAHRKRKLRWQFEMADEV